MNAVTSVIKSRELHIDFNQYTFGDVSFKLELPGLIIENIRSLKTSLMKTLESKESRPFLYECHKASPTIMMLNDAELSMKVRKLRAHFKNETPLNNLVLAKNVHQFNQICDSLILALSYVAKSIE